MGRQTVPQYYRLESAEERAKNFPNVFFLPDRNIREKVKTGYLVKLIFSGEEEDGRTYTERMWVKILSRRKLMYRGELVSSPAFLKNLIPHEPVVFGPEHICEISKSGN